MTYFQKIRKLYGIPDNENFGFYESELTALETRLHIQLPDTLREYYLTLGKFEALNYSYNRLLQFTKVKFSPDGYLLFYEEHQAVVTWGIKKEDLVNPNPPVYGNYSNDEQRPDWHFEFPLDACLLMLAVYTGVLGGLVYNGNYLDSVTPEIVNYVKENWQELEDVSSSMQRIYTREYTEVISLSFDKEQHCTGIFIGTNHREQFNALIDQLDVRWFYLSTEDMDDEEEDEE